MTTDDATTVLEIESTCSMAREEIEAAKAAFIAAREDLKDFAGELSLAKLASEITGVRGHAWFRFFFHAELTIGTTAVMEFIASVGAMIRSGQVAPGIESAKVLVALVQQACKQALRTNPKGANA